MRSPFVIWPWRIITCHAWIFAIGFFLLAAFLPSTGCDASITTDSPYDDRVMCMNAWMRSTSAMVAGFVVLFYWWTLGRRQCRRWESTR